MSGWLCMCLICVVPILSSSCKKSKVDTVPTAGTGSSTTTAGTTQTSAGPVAAAGVGGIAGMSVPEAGAGTSSQAGTDSSGTAGVSGAGASGSVASVGVAGGSAGTGGAMAGAGGVGGSAAGPGGAGGAAGAQRPIAKFPIRNLIVGACELTHAVADPSMCTGWDEIYECVAENCELAACERTCADYIACAEPLPDRCNLGTTCPKSDACDKCVYSVEACAIEPCELLFRCATPSADGACARLNACCQKQMDPLGCQTWHDRAAQILGDEGCQTFIDDPGFLSAYVNNPPCMP